MMDENPWWTKYSGAKDDFLIPLWLKKKQEDFYFSAIQEIGSGHTIIYVTPLEWFSNHGCLFTDSMPIIHLLPQGFIEIYPCIYEVKANVDFVSHRLRKLGFKHDPSFDDFAKQEQRRVQ